MSAETATPERLPASARVFARVLARDLRLELRGREALNAMLFYALLIIVIFSFAFEAQSELTIHAGGGLLWVAFLFAGLVALDRAFLREIPEACLTGLRLSPAARPAVLGGKMVSSFLLMTGIELLLLPLFAIFFNVPPGARWGAVIGVLLAGTWALASTGTFFSAMSVHTRYRALLLPLLLLPLAIPAVIAMVQSTQIFLNGGSGAGYWIELLLGFDVIFTCLGLLLADVVLEVG